MREQAYISGNRYSACDQDNILSLFLVMHLHMNQIKMGRKIGAINPMATNARAEVIFILV